MKTTDTITTTINENKGLTRKYDSHLPRSGEVSAALRTLPEASGLYDQVQHSEIVLYAAKKECDAAYAAYQASRAGKEQLRRTVLTMAKAAISVGEASGCTGLSDILVADDEDEASIASRLAGEITSVPFVGAAFSQGLTVLRQQLLAREAAHQEVVKAFVAATRDFGGAFYKAASIVAQAKALLFANGIKVNDRKVKKKKKPAEKNEEVTAPMPMPIAA